jgi:hypothetical protein
VSGDISRENWVVPVKGLARANPDGMARMVAGRDGSVILHLTCAGTEVSVRLDISRAAQFSTGIWEAAGVSQQLNGHLGDDWSPSPRPPRLRPVRTAPVRHAAGLRHSISEFLTGERSG